MVGVRNFAAELEREKIASRTREHLMTKARAGYNAGGRCYGYDNVEIRDGERRTRVEYVINPEQAKIVREIFEPVCGRLGTEEDHQGPERQKDPSSPGGQTWNGIVVAVSGPRDAST
jgi:DNA invertase Pin-like site-specific DNA recombinase